MFSLPVPGIILDGDRTNTHWSFPGRVDHLVYALQWSELHQNNVLTGALMIHSRFSLFLFSFLFCFVMLLSSSVSASISLPWQTTFDCPEWSQGSGSPNCDGITSTGGDWDCGNGTGEQITTDANFPGGRGGRGQRHWLGSSADNSGGLQIRFDTPQKEFWGRWYSRFQRGMDTTGRTMMFKMLYLHGAGTKYIGYLLFPETRDQVYYYEQNGGHVIHRSITGGFQTVYGSGVSDGSWFRVDVHLKAETAGRSDGVLQVWINGRLIIDTKQAQFGSPGGFDGFLMGSNHKGHNDDPTCMYVDFDDIAISNTGYIGDISGGDVNEGNVKGVPAPGNLKIIGNGDSSSGDAGGGSSDGSSNLGGVLLFEEKFDDASFASRGWYDNTNCQISTAEHLSGSSSSLQFRFPLNATTPTSGGAMRRKFTASDEVYLSYHVKYSSNWQGSNRSYHPHEILLLSNADGDYSNLANTHLTTYIEQNEGIPQIAIQDGLNVDQSRINQDLTSITENRAVAGCNGDSDGYSGSCYSNGSSYVNWKHLKAGDVYFQDSPGSRYKNDWHHIEAYIKMNTITNGIANADGIVRYTYDGAAVINRSNVVLRTGSRATMKFNQLIIAPYIGDGSPIDQTFWIDDLVVRTSIP